MHSMRQFAHEHRDRESAWFEESNTLAFLQVPNEEALRDIADRARHHRIAVAEFREPDLEESLTSVTVAPEGKRICRGLRKAMLGG
jgi:hypothetical protein